MQINANRNGTASEPSSLPLNSNALTKSCLWYSEKSFRAGNSSKARHWKISMQISCPNHWVDLLGKTAGKKTPQTVALSCSFTSPERSSWSWWPASSPTELYLNLIFLSIVRPLLRCEINLYNKCVSSWLLSQWDTNGAGIKTQTSYHKKYPNHPESKAGDNQLAPNCLSTGSGPAQCWPALNGLHFERGIFPRMMHCCPLLQSKFEDLVLEACSVLNIMYRFHLLLAYKLKGCGMVPSFRPPAWRFEIWTWITSDMFL